LKNDESLHFAGDALIEQTAMVKEIRESSISIILYTLRWAGLNSPQVPCLCLIPKQAALMAAFMD
jgi:hypothetical protein